MTKLKDLNQKHMRHAPARYRERGLVENSCGCWVQESKRYWIVQIPLMPVQRGGKEGTMVLTLFQCDKCKAIVDGRSEIIQKEEKLIQVAR